LYAAVDCRRSYGPLTNPPLPGGNSCRRPRRPRQAFPLPHREALTFLGVSRFFSSRPDHRGNRLCAGNSTVTLKSRLHHCPEGLWSNSVEGGNHDAREITRETCTAPSRSAGAPSALPAGLAQIRGASAAHSLHDCTNNSAWVFLSSDSRARPAASFSTLSTAGSGLNLLV